MNSYTNWARVFAREPRVFAYWEHEDAARIDQAFEALVKKDEFELARDWFDQNRQRFVENDDDCNNQNVQRD